MSVHKREKENENVVSQVVHKFEKIKYKVSSCPAVEGFLSDVVFGDDREDEPE